MSIADPRKGEHPDWGTKIFDYGKNEVKNFLIANALLLGGEVSMWTDCGWTRWPPCSIWITENRTGQWVPNKYGGNENLEAIEFFKHLNSVVRGTQSRAP